LLQFSFLMRAGACFAGMSELADGDCSRRALAAAPRGAFWAAGIECRDLTCGHQTHGVTIAVAGPGDQGRGIRPEMEAFPSTDGVMTREPGLPIGVSVADCVPVLLYDPVVRAGAVVHAGREGTRAGIAALAVGALADAFGCKPSDLFAVVGPSAGGCCYEVSEAIAADWAEAGLPVVGLHLDLWGANRQQLVGSGLVENRIEISGICTICSARFHSYRRDGDARRNMAVLAV